MYLRVNVNVITKQFNRTLVQKYISLHKYNTEIAYLFITIYCIYYY